MNKLTKVALLGTFTAAVAFIGCGGVDEIENSASAGNPPVAMAGAVAAGGAVSTTPIAGAPASPGGASNVAGSSSMAGAPANNNSGGCVVSQGRRSRGTLGALGLALAVVLAARRRRSAGSR
jgi:hypothetical protein